MKIINTIAALTCVGYALHYTDVLPASQYEVLASNAAVSLRGVIDKAIRTAIPAVAEAPKACPPTECKHEVVRTVAEAPKPVVVTVPAQPAAPAASVVSQPTWPSITMFQSHPATPAPAAAAVAQPAQQPEAQPSAQATTMTFSAATPALLASGVARPATSQEIAAVRTEPAVATPTKKSAGSEGIEKQAKIQKVAAPVHAKSLVKRRGVHEASRPQSDWVSGAMTRS